MFNIRGGGGGVAAAGVAGVASTHNGTDCECVCTGQIANASVPTVLNSSVGVLPQHQVVLPCHSTN